MPAFSTILTAGIAAGGLAMQFMGNSGAQQASREQVAAQQELTQAQLMQDKVRMDGAYLDANRRQLQTVRDAQVARATSLSAANNQGASKGSGLQGAYGQTGGELGVNTLGIQQNLGIAGMLYEIENSQVTPAKMGLAAAGGDLAAAQGMSSLGGSLIGSAGTFGKLSQGFGNPFSSSSSPSYNSSSSIGSGLSSAY